MLVDREQPIACELGGAGRWSLDHLFLDQDGVPTLVEVKRGTDTRIRREVVGQMLDYAANAVLHWPMEELRQRFSARCEASGGSAAQTLAEQLGGDQDYDAFWAKVAANLAAGRIRMLFVADRIPPELRKVVEFLNVQMRPAEVLAVELRQYQGQGLRTLVPIVLGQTQESIDQKAGATGAKPRRLWDQARILEAYEGHRDPEANATARNIVAWIAAKADRVVFNDAASYGYIAPEFGTGAHACAPFRLWTDGGVPVFFNQLKQTAAFSSLAARQELMGRLNAIAGVNIAADGLDKHQHVRLAVLTADHAAAFLGAMDWMVERLRGEVAAAA
jgi:hypothetical protein